MSDRKIEIDLDKSEELLKSLRGALDGVDPREKSLSADGKKAQAEAMWDKIKLFKNNPTVKEVVEHDGVDLPIRILSAQEFMDCQMEACARFNKIDLARQFPDLKLYFLMILVITRSLTSSPQNMDVAPYSEAFVSSLPFSSLIGLYRKWELVQEKYNCNIEAISADEFKYLMDVVEKKTPRCLIEITYPQLLRFTTKLLEIHTLHAAATATR